MRFRWAFYGRPIEQSYDKPRFEIIDEQRFVYPLYVVFLMAPSVHWDFAELQSWAPVFFGAVTVISLCVVAESAGVAARRGLSLRD